MVYVFRLDYAFRLIVEGLMVCTFSGGFLYELLFRRYKTFKSPTLFLKYRSRYEHGCQMLFTASVKR